MVYSDSPYYSLTVYDDVNQFTENRIKKKMDDRRTDGVHCFACDRSKNIVLGGLDGTISIYDLATEDETRQEEYTRKGISSCKNSSLYFLINTKIEIRLNSYGVIDDLNFISDSVVVGLSNEESIFRIDMRRMDEIDYIQGCYGIFTKNGNGTSGYIFR